MPHDAHGRKIELGDYIKTAPYNYSGGRKVVGRVVRMREGQSCTGDVAWLSYGKVEEDAFGADEAELVLKFDGSEPQVLTTQATAI